MTHEKLKEIKRASDDLREHFADFLHTVESSAFRSTADETSAMTADTNEQIHLAPMDIPDIAAELSLRLEQAEANAANDRRNAFDERCMLIDCIKELAMKSGGEGIAGLLTERDSILQSRDEITAQYNKRAEKIEFLTGDNERQRANIVKLSDKLGQLAHEAQELRKENADLRERFAALFLAKPVQCKGAATPIHLDGLGNAVIVNIPEGAFIVAEHLAVVMTSQFVSLNGRWLVRAEPIVANVLQQALNAMKTVGSGET